MDRVVKQARSAINEYIRVKLNNIPYQTLNTEDFSKFIAESNKLSLKIEYGGSMPALRGLILLNNDKSNSLVLLSDENNNCWKRFTLVKEICHIFLEHEHKIENDNALKMAEALMFHVAFLPNFLPTGDTSNLSKEAEKDYETFEALLGKINPLGAEETSAVVAAIEILIPAICKDWISKWIEQGCHLNDISSKLKVPNLILEHRLKDWGLKVPPLK